MDELQVIRFWGQTAQCIRWGLDWRHLEDAIEP